MPELGENTSKLHSREQLWDFSMLSLWQSHVKASRQIPCADFPVANLCGRWPHNWRVSLFRLCEAAFVAAGCGH